MIVIAAVVLYAVFVLGGIRFFRLVHQWDEEASRLWDEEVIRLTWERKSTVNSGTR